MLYRRSRRPAAATPGSAGDAYLFPRLHRRSQGVRWLRDARRLRTWVRGQAQHQGAGLAWPIEVDPRDGDNGLRATGFEEGAAGIGWVELQACKITRARADLRAGIEAGDWLSGSARLRGPAWPEDADGPRRPHQPEQRRPGVTWFLHDLWLHSGNRAYERTARASIDSLTRQAGSGRLGIFWYESRDAGRASIRAIPPGTRARPGCGLPRPMHGWHLDMPGEEPRI